MEVQDERSQSGKSAASGFFKKLKGIKNLQIIVVIFIIAVALIIYSTVTTAKDAKSADTGVSSVMTSDEQRLSAILGNLAGAGKVETMITQSDGKITGVLVIADGASDITVRVRLLDAAATALGVDKSIVSVFSRK